MNCNKLHYDLISDNITKHVEIHLVECASCRELYHKVNDTMAMLDVNVQIPETLASSIMERKGELSLPKVRRLNFSSIIQIAAAIMFGVFIGHKFGKIANSQIVEIKQDPINQYFKAHHFNVDNAAFKAPSLYTKNQND